jgi:hypothetical protein
MDLNEVINSYISDGYDYPGASSKTCQDVILSKIAKSALSNNVTIKGGVIIQHISKDKRRATRDFDLDFIRYSLEDSSVRHFIDVLNEVTDDVKMRITAPIEQLSHQEYHGKRVILELVDQQNNRIGTKLDIGVHNRLDIEQEEYCFELDSIGEHVMLMTNTKEQIFVEKMTSLLKLGRFSTRYKDIFDFYYFISTRGLNNDKLMKCFDEYIFNAQDMRESNIGDIYKRLSSIFQNKAYLMRAGTAHNNWLEIPISDVTARILLFIKALMI